MATFLVIVALVWFVSFIIEWDTKDEGASAEITATKLPLALTNQPKATDIFIHGSDAKWVREAKGENTDYIFTVGGFAEWEGYIGQIVAIRGRMARLEIWHETGHSTKSTFNDVPIGELKPVERLTSKINPKFKT